MSYKTDLPCICCGKYTENGNAFHHLKSRGSGGTDDSWNLVPCDMMCHTKYFHLKGLTWTAEKYPRVKEFLLKNNWEFCELRKKWTHAN